MDEVDHQRLDAALAQPRRRAPHLVLVEGRDLLPLGVHPLGDLQAQLARDQRLEGALEPVGRRPRAAAQLQDVAEAARGDEPGARALALEEGVGGRGRAVDDDLQIRGRRRGLGEGGQDAVGLVADGRRHLGHAHGAGGLVEEHEVGEGAADVDADEQRPPGSHEPFLYRGGRAKSIARPQRAASVP